MLKISKMLVFGSLVARISLDAQTAVITQHNDNLRTGANLSERVLTPRQVDATPSPRMHLWHEHIVDGMIYAQILYVPQLNIGGGIHNVVFAATSNSSVYAFNADSSQGWYWRTRLADESWLPATEHRPTIPQGGIMSTPVIDGQTMYVVFDTWNACCSLDQTPCAQVNVSFWLAALDLRTGAVLRHTKAISASVKSRAAPGHTDFSGKLQINRAGLLLTSDPMNPQEKYIDIAFAARWREEWKNYHGWVIRYSARTLQPSGAFCTSPERREFDEPSNCTPNPGDPPPSQGGAGIWQGGSGLVGDKDGNVYFLTGNGDSSPSSYGNSLVKLTPVRNRTGRYSSFSATAFSAAADDPTHASDWGNNDIDLGSGGPMLIPGTRSLVGGGKTGILYLWDALNLRKVQQVVAAHNKYVDPSQYESNRYADGPDPTGAGMWAEGPHLHGAPVYWQGYVYVWGEKDALKAFRYDPGPGRAHPSLNELPVAIGHDEHGNIIAPVNVMPGGAISLSANGDRDGIVWATSPVGDNGGRLLAFDATTLRKLWETPLPGTSKFTPPTIADGKVFVPTCVDPDRVRGGFQNRFQVYALGEPPRRPPDEKRPEPPIMIPLGDPAPYVTLLQQRFGVPAAEKLQPPQGYAPIFVTSAKGERVYWAQADSNGTNKLQWVLQDSSAVLRDATGLRLNHGYEGRGEVVGKQDGAGHWQMEDGSRVAAEIAASIEAVKEGLPWLLLKVVQHEGKGILDSVAYIQQLDTHGGLPPTQEELSKASAGQQVRVPYSATYVFYVSQPKVE